MSTRPNFAARLIIDEENRLAATAYQPKFATDDRGQHSHAAPPQHRAQPDPQINAVARGKDDGQALDEHPDDVEAENVDEHSAEGEVLRDIGALRIAPRGDGKAARGQKQIQEGILPVALEHGHNARNGLLPDIAFSVCHGSASQHAGHDQHQTGRHAGDDDAVIDPGHFLGELVGVGLHDLQPPLGLLVDELFNRALLGLCLLFQANSSSWSYRSSVSRAYCFVYLYQM